jgi:hypothetical protein
VVQRWATGWMVGVRNPVKAGNFSFLTASRPVLKSTRGSFPGGKAAGAWSWPLTSTYCRGQECVELYLHSPRRPSWRSAQLKHRDNFTFTFLDMVNVKKFKEKFIFALDSVYSFVTVRPDIQPKRSDCKPTCAFLRHWNARARAHTHTHTTVNAIPYA